MTAHDAPKVEDADVAAVADAVRAGQGVLVDVREDFEWRTGHAADAVHIPLMELPARLDELPRDTPVYLICATGNRSGRAAEFLGQNGFERPINVRGGTVAWRKAGLPMAKPE